MTEDSLKLCGQPSVGFNNFSPCRVHLECVLGEHPAPRVQLAAARWGVDQVPGMFPKTLLKAARTL